ncbi:hypothetical protein [Streptomyces sp. NPDC006610]|uniref:glycosyltransferase family 2 protein n=1 Tax=Streptomyces sp. NPDC006610 TaxID=3154584 RepID=UPI0033A1C439
MPKPRIDVIVLTMNDRPSEETAAQETLVAQAGVDVRVCVVGTGCRPEVVPPGALSISLPENVGIPAGRNAGAEALRQAGNPRTDCSSSTTTPASHAPTSSSGSSPRPSSIRKRPGYSPG